MATGKEELMNLIAAVDKNWAIGSNDDLLFRISTDLKRFRQLTTDKTEIYGRRTMETFPGGKPLKNRRNIVLSRQNSIAVEGAAICHNRDELFILLNKLQETAEITDSDVFVIGGASVYKMLLPYCKRAYITYIYAEGDNPDCFLVPLDNQKGWQLSETSEIMQDNGLCFDYRTYVQAEPASWMQVQENDRT
jgi:dihydrofolate reductase